MDISRKIGLCRVIWMEHSNQYLFMEEPAYSVYVLYKGGIKVEDIIVWFTRKYKITELKARIFIEELILAYEEQNTKKTGSDKPESPQQIQKPKVFKSVRHYLINHTVFAFHFESSDIEKLFHAYFFHLTCSVENKQSNYYFFIADDCLVIQKDGFTLGNWNKKNLPLAKSTFFMDILNDIYKKKDEDWITILHASAIVKDDRCIIFPGISGAGKSVLSLIFQKFGYHLISDDYVPVATNKRVYKFPASVSVKPGAKDLLMSLYPDITESTDYILWNDEIKLKPCRHNEYSKTGYQTKLVMFVSYKPDEPFTVKSITSEDGFKLLIPDNWFSSITENVVKLMDWIPDLDFYKITYSDYNDLVPWVETIMS